MSSTATHDTKRGEDVRARINVLSELPGEWQKTLSRWNRLNHRHRSHVEGADAPDRNDEYLLYQTLIGAWPLESSELAEFPKRIVEYMTKAVHEAKVHSSWTNPNSAYDDAVRQFVARILDEKHSALFLKSFRVLQQRVSHIGLFHALGQTLLKITAPGVPDFYQGTELWDFSLVDPDNRRPVDYGRREKVLESLIGEARDAGDRLDSFARKLVEHKEDGRIKCYLIWRALQYRIAHTRLFDEGAYLPLAISGSRAEHVFAFARKTENGCVIVAVPRLLAEVIPGAPHVPLGTEIWQDTVVIMPGELPPGPYRNMFTGATISANQREGRNEIAVAELFASFPVALLGSC